ncbi:GNAT family N-acetyltransferase [Candidatus Woesearchaeota archaeon]|nr:GNAT family N-acetyltransferase [Candidatus Woesearchaeota archaeon]
MTQDPPVGFEDLTEDNWDEFEDAVIGIEEESFPEKLQFYDNNFIDLLSTPGCIARALVSGDYYLGNVIGHPPTEEDLKGENLEGLVKTEKTLLLATIAIEPKIRRQGYGRMLLEEFIRCAKYQGYERIVGTFRPNGSLHLIKSMGAKELRRHPDWGGTGEEYVSCVLELR